MFFHHDNLKVYIDELNTVGRQVRMVVSGEAQSSGGVYYPHWKKGGMEKMQRFKDDVLPNLVKEVDEIDSHMKKGNFLKKVRGLVFNQPRPGSNSPALLQRGKYVRRLYEDEVEFERKFQEIHRIHDKITPAVAKLKEALDCKSSFSYNAWDILDCIRDLKSWLDKLHEASKSLGRLVRKFLSEIDAEHKLKTQLLRVETKQIKSFSENIKSWIHLSE